MKQLKLGDVTVDVVQKDIKNIHLSVYPPTGRVRISAPNHMDLETIRVFAISKIGWIRKQQDKIQGQEREAPREFLNRESHYYKGERYLLRVIEREAPPKVELKHNVIELQVRPDSTWEKKNEILNEWYRKQLKKEIPPIIEKWERIMNVEVKEYGVKKMRTKWGTCNKDAGRIWVNLELAKKPVECLEYIIVHEMVHLFERSHNQRFITLMDKFMPQWRSYRDELNRLPVSHEDWRY